MLNTQLNEQGLFLTFNLNGKNTADLNDWSNNASDDNRSIIALVMMLLDSNDALEYEDGILIPHSTIANIDNTQASVLELPLSIPFVLDIQHEKTFDNDCFRYKYSWINKGRRIVAPKRNGAILTAGSNSYRIHEPLYTVITEMDTYNANPLQTTDERFENWGEIRGHIYKEEDSGLHEDRYLKNTRVAVPNAFSLTFVDTDGEFNFSPVLKSNQLIENEFDDDNHLETSDSLPDNYQSIFSNRFKKFDSIRNNYALENGWYVVVDKKLQEVLNVVKQYQSKPEDERRKFASNPRAYIRKELDETYSEEEIEALFIETEAYSQRVTGFGQWHKKLVPWVKMQPNPWLPPEELGVIIDGKRITLTPEEVDIERGKVEEAIKSGKSKVNIKGIELPATPETLKEFEHLVALAKPDNEKPKDELEKETDDKNNKLVLYIDDNFENASYVVQARKTQTSDYELPIQLKSTLKPHQVDGLKWLQAHWRKGSPGALLADDMGLGKTLECLAYFAWLRNEMDAGYITAKPLLVVAPVGLLKNWEEEHDKHLDSPGLGQLIRAYGSHLKPFKQKGATSGTDIKSGLPSLNTDLFKDAGWILTTYETLRDYQHSFGKIPYAAIGFDESQKIKTPGTLVTDAAKAMNADFTLTITGTPIENRLSDLWCIIDTSQPGKLLDLKSFSKKYESKEVTEEALRELKEQLVSDTNETPSLMLRRTKEDNLTGLPEKKEHILREFMPRVQADSYTNVIHTAKQGGGKGYMLKALKNMRDVSLHPSRFTDQPPSEYIQQSARLKLAFEILDGVYKNNEKALIFLESREMQEILCILLQHRYKLEQRPPVINGAISGQKRQERVNTFQDKVGFDVMLLSPKAGGVGLTLTAANHVIHLSRWWNPAVEDQCSDRAYRIGQDKQVNIYYPIAVHPDFQDHSYDLQLNSLLEKKRHLSREMLMPPSVSSDDVNNLFNETINTEEGSKVKNITIDDIDNMEPIQFEDFVLSQLSDIGYRIKRTPRSHDMGADGIAEWIDDSKRTIIIQCKHIQSSTTCSEEAVEDLIRAKDAYAYEKPILVAITNAKKYSERAQILASTQDISLISRNNILDWFKSY